MPFFGHDPVFYDLQEAQAEAAHKAAQTLQALAQDLSQAPRYAEAAKKIESEADNLTHDLVSKADAKFITPLDKSDLHSLSHALDNITDTLEATVARVTLGTRIIDLQPINGFAAETAASVVLATASALSMPVSTTHIVCGSVFGVGIAKRLNEVRWPIAQRMVTAWVFTLPGAALVAGLSFFVIQLTGGHHQAVAMR